MCARFWVKGFKVKVDQDKSSLYLKISISLVLTSSWPQEAGDMILGLVAMFKSGQHRFCQWEQPFLHFTHAVKQASWPCFKENQSLDFMYNLMISMLATIFLFFPRKKKWERNLHSDVLESAFSLCNFLFLA